MELKEYAKRSQLSLKFLRWMNRKKVIQNPLTEQDIWGLKMLEKIWGKSENIRAQLTKYPKERRLQLLTTPDFETKWERYAYTRFSKSNNGNRIPMKKVINELEMAFGFVLDHRQKQRLYKVRQKAYNKRKKLVNRNKIEA